MSTFHLIFFIGVLLSVSLRAFLGSSSCFLHQFMQQRNRQLEQKTDRFWTYQEESNSWVELELPFDLVSCLDGNCTKVGVIEQTRKQKDENFEKESDATDQKEENFEKDGFKKSKPSIKLAQRKRISLTKMTDSSIWITGESGAIYERFWNGVQWVLAPHELPPSAGHAKSVIIVNQTILAISEEGHLYQMQINESSQLVWVDVTPTSSHKSKETQQTSVALIETGVASHDGVVYFCSKNGMLLELSEVHPISQTLRWENHGRPPGADVAAIADVTTIKTEVVYTICSAGDLYEFDKSSRPSWKKHLQKEKPGKDGGFLPSPGCFLHALNEESSASLFLLEKGGQLVERRLYRRKWKWITHGSPEDHSLTSITPLMQDERNEKVFSLFFTTSNGSIFEYQIPKPSGTAQETQLTETWMNHGHPPHARVARGISGLNIQPGRLLFPLDDGRVAELHMPGLVGETSKPKYQVNSRKRPSTKYIWSVLDAPESEGWNAEYCTEERGPMNCMAGIKDETNDAGMTRSLTRRRRGNTAAQQDYLTPATSTGKLSKSFEEYKYPDNWINSNFRLRVMHEGRSLFLITNSGLTLEYLNAESVWIWLRHENPTPMRGALGNYNGSLFFVDTYGSLFIRERTIGALEWINCTSMRKGRQVIGGPPWDRIPGKAIIKATLDDALFFISKTGRLLQFTVALRKFKWKDCKHPSNTKVASIVDQEMLRYNIVFVIGRNGRLYQYNKVSELWHEHHQSQHLVLSRVTGAAMRPSTGSLTGSLFMLSEDGRLVEYHWNAWDGWWNWVEHGTPYKDVALGGSPGPCFKGNQLFLIGSDGNVYLRFMDELTWRWHNCGFPCTGNKDQTGVHGTTEGVCMNNDFAASLEEDSGTQHETDRKCDPKVAPTKPIPFSEDSVIFELRDGRLAEMRRAQEKQWFWSRIIDTPTSLCVASYWAALAS